jgi:hypothetical protein
VPRLNAELEAPAANALGPQPPENHHAEAVEDETVYWSRFVPMTREQWNVTDPSEAVRSNEIIPLLRKTFDRVDVQPMGGSILQFSLYDIAANFAAETRENRAFLEMLFSIEEVLGEFDTDIPVDYAAILAGNSEGTNPRGSIATTKVMV